jgi:hypothetical protein
MKNIALLKEEEYLLQLRQQIVETALSLAESWISRAGLKAGVPA